MVLYIARIFLFEHCGNPNKTNGKKETALHCVCMEKNPQYYPVQRRRLECLNMMLQWRGAELKDGEIERVDLAAVDEVCKALQSSFSFTFRLLYI